MSNNKQAPDRAPIEAVLAFEQLRNITIDVNQPKRRSAKWRAQQAALAASLRLELSYNYSDEAIQQVEMGEAGVPLPE